MRYSKTETIETKSGEIRLATPTFYNITEQDIGEYRVVTVKKGARLDNIAYQHYGDPKLWWILALVNELKTPFVGETLNLVVPLNYNLILAKVL